MIEQDYAHIIAEQKERLANGSHCTRCGMMMKYKISFEVAQHIYDILTKETEK